MIVWQEVVPVVGNIIFAAALIPSILSKHKPHRWTCAMTAGVLSVYVFTFWDMSLWYWSLATLATTTAWFVLLFQKRK